MRILVIAAKIHNFFRAQRRLDRLVIKIPGASQSSVYKNRFQQEAESVAPPYYCIFKNISCIFYKFLWFC